MEGSDVEQILSNDDSLQTHSSSSHFPSQNSFNSRPNSFCSGGTVTPNIIVTPSDDEDALIVELLSHKLNELTNSSSSENNFDPESIDENDFYIKEVADSDNFSDGSFDHIDAFNDYGHMMRSMKSMHNINDEEEDESDIEEIHLEVIHEDLSIITEEGSNLNKSNESLLSDGTMVDYDFNDINEVTARLPLRLSFSKSQNDEDVATVEVGDSEYEDKHGRSLSITSDGYQEIVPREEWQDVDVFWSTTNNEELQVERKNNYKKAVELFSQPKCNFVPIPNTVVNLSSEKPETNQLPTGTSIENDWQDVDDFWSTPNTAQVEEGRKSNYKNAMAFFTTTIQENPKVEPKVLTLASDIRGDHEDKRPCSKKIESFEKEIIDSEYKEVNDEGESIERRSNYKNARSFFASAVDNNTSVDHSTQEVKKPLQEQKWWEYDASSNDPHASKEEIKQDSQYARNDLVIKAAAEEDDESLLETKANTKKDSKAMESNCFQAHDEEVTFERDEPKRALKWWEVNSEDVSNKEIQYQNTKQSERVTNTELPETEWSEISSVDQLKTEDDEPQGWWKADGFKKQKETFELDKNLVSTNITELSALIDQLGVKGNETKEWREINDTEKEVTEANIHLEPTRNLAESTKTSHTKGWWEPEDPEKEVIEQDTKLESTTKIDLEPIDQPNSKEKDDSEKEVTGQGATLEPTYGISLSRNDQPEIKACETKQWWETDDTEKEVIEQSPEPITEIKNQANANKGWWETEENMKEQEVDEDKNYRPDIIANETKGWWETDDKEQEVDVEDHNLESTNETNNKSYQPDSISNETKGWWETDDNEQEVNKEDHNLESTTKTNNKNYRPDIIANEAKGWWELHETVNEQKDGEDHTNLESTTINNKLEINNQTKGWWEEDDNQEPSPKLIPEAKVDETKGWWETTQATENNEEVTENSKQPESTDVSMLIEEKPWWQNECEAPIWLNTEDLESDNIAPQNNLETNTEQKENVTRRSPSKAKEEISKRRSWWETRETSDEPSVNKRYSLIEDDRKSVPKLEDLVSNPFGDEIKIKSIKERIQMLEISDNKLEEQLDQTEKDMERGSLSRNDSQRSEIESEVDEDSGVTDMLPGNSSQQISETDDTESENFPELRKMNRYTRAATHSRLFKLLQEENDIEDNAEDEFKFTPSKKNIVHNVSITRRQKPESIKNAESMAARRERLSLPLRKNTSIDNDNPSTPNSPRSPSASRASSTSRYIQKSKEEITSSVVNDQLVAELVQSLLLKKGGDKLKNLPMEKLQAAAKKVLEEQLDSLESTSIDSTPAITPSQDLNASDYSDYYDSWRTSVEDSDNGDYEIVPSKSFRRLQETSSSGKRLPLARCPRVLSSRTVNRDLARVTESPEIVRNSSDRERDPVLRCHSASRWVKIS